MTAALLLVGVACGGNAVPGADAGGPDPAQGDGAPPGDANGGGDAAQDAAPGDAARDGAMLDGATDSGSGWGCGLLAPPTASDVCCSSCGSGSSCQANGCFGGWWCDTGACRCVSAPSASECGSMGGTIDGWPMTTGALACTASASYSSASSSGSCGRWRWSIKTGIDADAPGVNTTPRITTVADLRGLAPPPTLDFGTRRTPPAETTVYELRNVHVSFIGRSMDSDNHMVVGDGDQTMIVEVPYPGCVGLSSPFGCNISHARATVDRTFGPVDHGMSVDQTATIIGVGFFDFVHMQPGVAPNGIELHPVLALCFGADCDPLVG